LKSTVSFVTVINACFSDLFYQWYVLNLSLTHSIKFYSKNKALVMLTHCFHRRLQNSTCNTTCM